MCFRFLVSSTWDITVPSRKGAVIIKEMESTHGFARYVFYGLISFLYRAQAALWQHARSADSAWKLGQEGKTGPLAGRQWVLNAVVPQTTSRHFRAKIDLW